MRQDGMLFTARVAVEQIAAEAVVKLGRGYRLVQPRSNDEVADVSVGFQEDRGRKEHVVNANHALFVQVAIVDERRSAMQREVQRVVQIMVEVGARRDEEVDEAP